MKLKQNETNLKYQLNQIIWEAWQKAAKNNKWDIDLVKLNDIKLEHPELEKFGDYTCNLAMVLASKLKQNPQFIAQKIVDILNKNPLEELEKIEIVKPGFINISIKNSYFISQLQKLLKRDDAWFSFGSLDLKKVMVEFAHPNTHKSFHIGHLRNICIGESLVRILEANGVKVVRGNYQGDVGMHIAKCLHGVLQDKDYEGKLSKLKSLDKKTKYLTDSYVLGNKLYQESEANKAATRDINFLVYAAAQQYQQKEHKIKPGSTDYLKFVKGKNIQLNKIYDLWVLTRQWSLDYFERVYKRVYSHFDRYYFESECLGGVDKSYEALKKGVLNKSKGAVVFNGEPHGIDTRVFINSMGLPTYEGKELALAPVELSEHGHLDKIIHVVGPEQISFFQITFKVEELLGMQKDQQHHLAYGWVRLKKGKMSSRLGNIILGEQLLDEAKKRIKISFKDLNDGTAEIIAVGAVKYSLLKHGVSKDMAFDFEESISLAGNSGPYLQYTAVRCQSVLTKAKMSLGELGKGINLNKEELSLLRWLNRFSNVVGEAGLSFSPNLVCNYLYELAQRYNTFYNQHKILEAKTSEQKELRLALTKLVVKMLVRGLDLLGIKTPEKM